MLFMNPNTDGVNTKQIKAIAIFFTNLPGAAFPFEILSGFINAVSIEYASTNSTTTPTNIYILPVMSAISEEFIILLPARIIKT